MVDSVDWGVFALTGADAGAGLAAVEWAEVLLLDGLLELALLVAGAGALAASIWSNPGILFNFASRTASRISTSVILLDSFEILSSITSVKLLKKTDVLAIKLFIKTSVFVTGIGLIYSGKWMSIQETTQQCGKNSSIPWTCQLYS